MSTIKKAYVAIISLMEANPGALVEEILPQAIELASAKTGGGGGKATAHHKDENGEVTAVHCFYHQVWMDPREVEFGKKASSATGLNSMCKEGVSKWTKQQRAFKQGKEDLLEAVSTGEIEAGDVAEAIADLEETRKIIVPLEGDYKGFETLDECLAAS